MRKTLLAVAFLLLSSVFSSTVVCQVVCEKENLEKLFIETKDLEKYFNKHFTPKDIKFEEMQVFERNKSYYLLAIQNDSEEVYAFRLFRKPGSSSLKLMPLNYVTNCNCGKLDINMFMFDGKKIVGVNGDYTFSAQGIY